MQNAIHNRSLFLLMWPQMLAPATGTISPCDIFSASRITARAGFQEGVIGVNEKAGKQASVLAGS